MPYDKPYRKRNLKVNTQTKIDIKLLSMRLNPEWEFIKLQNITKNGIQQLASQLYAGF